MKGHYSSKRLQKQTKTTQEFESVMRNIQPNEFNTFSCPECFTTIKAKRHLATHLKRHYNLLPYKCLICDKRFSLPMELKQHENLHNGIREFACKFCEKKYSSKGALQFHTSKHHPTVDVVVAPSIAFLNLTQQSDLSFEKDFETQNQGISLDVLQETSTNELIDEIRDDRTKEAETHNFSTNLESDLNISSDTDGYDNVEEK